MASANETSDHLASEVENDKRAAESQQTQAEENKMQDETQDDCDNKQEDHPQGSDENLRGRGGNRRSFRGRFRGRGYFKYNQQARGGQHGPRSADDAHPDDQGPPRGRGSFYGQPKTRGTKFLTVSASSSNRDVQICNDDKLVIKVDLSQSNIPGHQHQQLKQNNHYQRQRSSTNENEGEQPSHRNPDYRNSDNRTSDNRNPDNRNPDHRNPDYRNPDHRNPDYRNPDYRNPDYRNPDHRNPDYRNPDHRNPDYRNLDHRPYGRGNRSGEVRFFSTGHQEGGRSEFHYDHRPDHHNHPMGRSLDHHRRAYRPPRRGGGRWQRGFLPQRDMGDMHARGDDDPFRGSRWFRLPRAGRIFRRRGQNHNRGGGHDSPKHNEETDQQHKAGSENLDDKDFGHEAQELEHEGVAEETTQNSGEVGDFHEGEEEGEYQDDEGEAYHDTEDTQEGYEERPSNEQESLTQNEETTSTTDGGVPSEASLGRKTNGAMELIVSKDVSMTSAGITPEAEIKVLVNQNESDRSHSSDVVPKDTKGQIVSEQGSNLPGDAKSTSNMVEDATPSNVVTETPPSNVGEDIPPSNVVKDAPLSNVVEDATPLNVVKDAPPSNDTSPSKKENVKAEDGDETQSIESNPIPIEGDRSPSQGAKEVKRLEGEGTSAMQD